VLARAEDVIEYAWKSAVGRLDGKDSVSGRSQVIQEFLQTAASAIYAGQMDEISMGVLVGRLCNLMDIPAGRIDDELTRMVKEKVKSAPEAERTKTPDSRTDTFEQAQREVLEVLLNEPGLYVGYAGQILPNMFTGKMKPIADVLFDFLKQGIEPAIAQVLGRLEDVESAKLLTDMERQGSEKGNYLPRLDQACRTLNISLLEQQTAQLKQSLGGENDTESLTQIQSLLTQRGVNPRNIGFTGS
jgi:hypothetical protein